MPHYHLDPRIAKTMMCKVDSWAAEFELFQDARYVSASWSGLPTTANKERTDSLHQTARDRSL